MLTAQVTDHQHGRVPFTVAIGGRDSRLDDQAGPMLHQDMAQVAEAGFPGVGTLHWQSMLAPAQTPKPVLDTLFKAIVEGSKQPGLKEAFDKQLVSIKVSASPDEAKTWLKGELDAWRKITSEVKIDLAE